MDEELDKNTIKAIKSAFLPAYAKDGFKEALLNRVLVSTHIGTSHEERRMKYYTRLLVIAIGFTIIMAMIFGLWLPSTIKLPN